ncbi:hypothetical protein MMC21_005127 [Puttea exsequens]|nr:hypothetical protein [Puttea exsequens]
MYQYRSPLASDINAFDPYEPSSRATSFGSPSPSYVLSNLSRMSSSSMASTATSVSASNVAQRSSTWQDKLHEHCRVRHIPLPAYNVLSDRRGKRTAWSCTVSVSGQNVPARYWYDGQYVNTAKEDAAEAALQKLLGKNGAGGGGGTAGQRGVAWTR